jgi:hypothetical protein
MYEMTISLLLTPENPGVPIPIKPLQAQHRAAIHLDRPLSEETGRLLGEWAAGGVTPARKAVSPGGAEADPIITDGGEVGSIGDYIKLWDDRLIQAQAEHVIREIGLIWNSDNEKDMRRKLFAPHDPELAKLIGRVKAKLNELNKPDAEAVR